MTTPEQKTENQIIENRVFNKTFTMETDSIEPIMCSLQADFGLCEADFLRIKHGYPKTLLWAHSIFMVAIGLGISILGKYIDEMINKTSNLILPWEIYGSILALFVGGILYVVGFGLNEKKKVMKDIEKHFENAPRTKHIVSK